MRARRLLLSALTLSTLGLAAVSTCAQTKLQFDVVSIKRNLSGEPRGILSFDPASDSLVIDNTPMYRIVGFAFNFQRSDLVLGAPDWTYSERWNMQAKVSADDVAVFRTLTLPQKQAMLQMVLKERCNLQARPIQKEVPVYALVLAGGGSKMHEIPSSESKDKNVRGWDLTQKHGEIIGRAVPMAALLYALGDLKLGRQVIDRSNLEGLYDFNLAWTPDDEADGDNGLNPSHRLSIFTAIQDQLGLRLEPTHAPVRALSIEHIDRPTSN